MAGGVVWPRGFQPAWHAGRSVLLPWGEGTASVGRCDADLLCVGLQQARLYPKGRFAAVGMADERTALPAPGAGLRWLRYETQAGPARAIGQAGFMASVTIPGSQAAAAPMEHGMWHGARFLRQCSDCRHPHASSLNKRRSLSNLYVGHRSRGQGFLGGRDRDRIRGPDSPTRPARRFASRFGYRPRHAAVRPDRGPCARAISVRDGSVRFGSAGSQACGAFCTRAARACAEKMCLARLASPMASAEIRGRRPTRLGLPRGGRGTGTAP